MTLVNTSKGLQTKEQLVDTYEGYYKELFENKLKELQYDGVETLLDWKDDPEFGEEATALLYWRKAMIKTNFAILEKLKQNLKYNEAWIAVIPTKDEYLAALPQYGVQDVY